MKNLLEFILLHLVSKPEAVAVEETTDEQGVIFKLKVDTEDIGRVIGRQGKIIKAIRKVANVLQIKENSHARIVLES